MPAGVEVSTLTDKESWDLSAEFAVMLSKLITLMDKAVDVETLKCFLQFFCDVRTGQPYVEPSIYQHCTSTAEVLKALLQHLRFHAIQPKILNTIVESYGCKACKHLLQEYKAKIPKSATLKMSSNELTDEEIESSSGTKRLKVEVSGNSDTFCLEDVERTQEALETSSGVSRDVTVFAKHEPGSVILTFIVPACTVVSFTDISKSETQLTALAAIGILSIEIDKVTINVKAHLVFQKLEWLTLKEQVAAHPTPQKPSTLKPTPSSESTDSGGVEDPTVSQHGLFQSSAPTLSTPLRGRVAKPRRRRGSSKPCSLLCFSGIPLFLLQSPPMCTYTCVRKWLAPQAPPRCIHPRVNRYSKTTQHLAVTRIHNHESYE